MTLPINAYLLVEQLRQILHRTNLKQSSLLFSRVLPQLQEQQQQDEK